MQKSLRGKTVNDYIMHYTSLDDQALVVLQTYAIQNDNVKKNRKRLLEKIK
jgi:hypothetical protein